MNYLTMVSTSELSFLKKLVAELELQTKQQQDNYDNLKNLHEQYKQKRVIETTRYSNDGADAKRTEDALQDGEGKYRLVFDSANDAILIYDLQGQILEVNPMACNRLGYTQTELKSMTVNQVYTSESTIQIPERLETLHKHGCLTFEVVHQCKDGTTLPTDVSARQITWDGQPAIMNICRDITRWKQVSCVRQVQQIVFLARSGGHEVKPVAENGPMCCSSEAAGPFVMLPIASGALSSVLVKDSCRDSGALRSSSRAFPLPALGSASNSFVHWGRSEPPVYDV